MKRFFLAVAGGAALCASLAGVAQDYPAKPIRIIVGYAAGGGNDIIVRVMSDELARGLGQPVIVENKPGAQSIIAAEFVARAAPDGYTVLMGPSGPMAMNPAIYSKLSYSPQRDFAPVSMIGSFPLVLTVDPKLGLGSVKELAAYARANPDRVNYGASAAAFQLSTELLNQRLGTKFAFIPYKGSGESVNAVASGQVTMTLSDPPPATPQIKSGRVRAIAVTSASRHANWPDVPTLAESGLPDMVITIWTAFFVPAATPRPVVERLQKEVARVVRVPEVRARLLGMGVDPVGGASEELGRTLASDIERWTAVAKTAGIKAD